ncbi:MAG: portal protein [Alphaproteobacteria bacterium]
MQPKAKDTREIEGILQDAIAQAVDFVESEITQDRIKAQRYFDGEVDIGYEDGRSKVVATKVRDTIRAVKPSLMRVFMSTAKPVEFVPRGPEDVALAEQATEYMHYVFNQNDGYRVLNDAFHDALVKKTGIVKAYWETKYRAEIFTYDNLTDEEYTMIVSDDDVTILEHTVISSVSMDEFGTEVELPTHDLKISRQMPEGKMRFESVPPEEFFINSQARNIDEAYVVAHRTEMRVGELVEMGYDFEDVYDLDSLYGASDISEAETIERQGYSQDDYEDQSGDPAMRSVAITEAYMKIDVDGTGVPVLHRFICGGSDYKLLDFEPIDNIPFAVFEVDPEPHTFYGRSLAEIVMDDQDASTAILRGVLDNVAMTNNPRIGIVDGAVNIDDVLNNEIGAIVRMRQAGSVQELTVPFTAGQTLGALTYMDQLVENKTGVSRASMGLDPDAMQSTTKAAVQATIQAQAGQVEVMVRNLADGMKNLFKIMLHLHVKHSDEEQMMRMNGRFIPVDPSVWNADMDVSINVGLGTGREEEKMMALQQAFSIQQQVYTQYGPFNGMVSLTNIRNTLSDMLAAAGIRNSDRYFAPITPEVEQQLLMLQQQAQAQQAQGTDPNQAFLAAEQMKAQAKVQSDMMKLQLDAQKAAAEDDRERDKMAQDLMVDAAKIYGQYGTAVDVARVKAEQDKLRTIAGIAQQ